MIHCEIYFERFLIVVLVRLAGCEHNIELLTLFHESGVTVLNELKQHEFNLLESKPIQLMKLFC